jgi:hypothetical protein
MAMKKIWVAGRWIYMEADHADRIIQKMAEVSEMIQIRVKRRLAAKEGRDRRIAREMKQRGIGPNGSGSQLAGWIPSGQKRNKKKTLQTINGNPLVYSI